MLFNRFIFVFGYTLDIVIITFSLLIHIKGMALIQFYIILAASSQSYFEQKPKSTTYLERAKQKQANARYSPIMFPPPGSVSDSLSIKSQNNTPRSRARRPSISPTFKQARLSWVQVDRL